MTDFCKYSDDHASKYLSNAEGSPLTIQVFPNIEHFQ